MPRHVLLTDHTEDLDPKAPDWMHLLPVGLALEDGFSQINTNDGRVFRAPPMEQLVSGFGRKIPVDIGHATHESPLFGGSPMDKAAVGWITGLEARDSGLWGKVDWLERGRKLVEGREFTRQSPTLELDDDGTITGLVSAALTNTPALTLVELAARQQTQEPDMDKYQLLCARLSLSKEAGADDILEACRKGYCPTTERDAALSRAECAEKAVADAGAAAFASKVESVIGAACEAGKIKPADKAFFLAGCSNEEGLARTVAHLATLAATPLKSEVAPNGSPDSKPGLTARQIQFCKDAKIDPKDHAARLGLV